MTTLTQLPVALVETPTQEISKAKAIITVAEDGTGHFTAYDRRTGVALVDRDVKLTKVSDSPEQWMAGGEDPGEFLRVTRMTTCGCGGTRVNPRS